MDLPVSDNIPARCSCSAVIDSEFFPNHIQGCTKNRRRGATARHDNLVRLLASICYTAGNVSASEMRIASAHENRLFLLQITYLLLENLTTDPLLQIVDQFQ